jgi:hypothetical protein
MKCITKITLFALGLVVPACLTGVWSGFRPLAELQATAQAAGDQVLTLDVAVDCRTFVGGPNRGDVVIVSGKIFPGGTLPSGAATFDPIQPVNGVAPIGNWTQRGQNSFPFPPAVASAYSSTPFAFGTIYFILNDGRALTTEGYLLPSAVPPGIVFSSVTGGIGGFSGASGFLEGPAIGTNATGCPNARATFHIQPGSVR